MAAGMTRVDQHVVDIGLRPASNTGAPGRGFLGRDPAPCVRRDSRTRIVDVLRTVEADIIPCLLLARRQEANLDEAALAGTSKAEIAGFVRRLVALENEAASNFVEAVRARGLSTEDVYLQLFQPAARHLGELWEADLCTFVDVTLALGTLHQLLRDLSPAFQSLARRLDAGRQALLVPLPGDQHTFGLSMVTEFFRRSAWGVWTAPFRSLAELGAATHNTWFTVVGFSVGCEARLDDLAAAIRVVRHASCNEAIGVLVGGPVFFEHPEYVAHVGADAMGLDARQAVFEAECFASSMTGR